ncbi:MAG TPA: amino acid ABC transporter substrate-binding protein [Burkholderiaceae bacterium]|nr:amino acid ABC transporter substrate-binding protein [Burkholderiaceae bacterium]
MRRDAAPLACRLPAALAAIGAAACCLVAAPAWAQTDEAPRALTGVLKRIKETRVVRIGVREAAAPFASLTASGQASGYSVDLCLAIVDDLAKALGVGTLPVKYRRVTPANRIEQVARGRIDLECGATTNTAERRERVAFSPPMFIAGTQLLVKRGSAIRSVNDLADGKVVVVRHTTNEAAMRHWAAEAKRRLQLVVAEDYESALARVTSGEVAALAADDVLLVNYIAERNLRRQYAVVGELLSYEPYGIMYAKDDEAMRALVHATFRRLATTGEIRSIYNKWFIRSLPSGLQLKWPMSTHLALTFELLGMPRE